MPGQAHHSVQEGLGVVFAMEEDGLTDRKSVATRLVQERTRSRHIHRAVAGDISKTGRPRSRGDSKELLKWGFDVDVVKDVLPQFENQNFHGMVRDILEEGGKGPLSARRAKSRMGRKARDTGGSRGLEELWE